MKEIRAKKWCKGLPKRETINHTRLYVILLKVKIVNTIVGCYENIKGCR